MAIFVRRGKIRDIAKEIRVGIAKELGVDVLEIPLVQIEEIVYAIVDSYNTFILRDRKETVNAGRLIARLAKTLCEKSGTGIEENEREKEEKHEQETEEMSEEEIEKILKEAE